MRGLDAPRRGAHLALFISIGISLCVRGSAPTDAAPDPTGVARASERAIGLALRGRLAQADSILESLLDLAPRDPGILSNLGNIQVLRGDYEAALAFYDEALAQGRADPGILLDRSIALLLKGDESAARVEAARALRLAG